MSAAFTPGPWACSTRTGERWDWVVHSEADPNIEVCQMFHDGTDLNERGEANARLIAAAPELYEALEHDIRFFDSIATGIANLCNGYASRRRELLAKVRGEQ